MKENEERKENDEGGDGLCLAEEEEGACVCGGRGSGGSGRVEQRKRENRREGLSEKEMWGGGKEIRSNLIKDYRQKFIDEKIHRYVTFTLLTKKRALLMEIYRQKIRWYVTFTLPTEKRVFLTEKFKISKTYFSEADRKIFTDGRIIDNFFFAFLTYYPFYDKNIR